MLPTSRMVIKRVVKYAYRYTPKHLPMELLYNVPGGDAGGAGACHRQNVVRNPVTTVDMALGNVVGQAY